ncbi:MAG: tripartite tricarboxylate transporter TctB family protein [Clostridia bacterium]
MNASNSQNKRGNWPDIAFGMLLIGVSVLVLIETRNLQMGTTMDMGAGFMPKVLATILGVSGIAVVIRNAFRSQVKIEKVKVRSLVLVLASFAAFALLLPKFGVVVSTIVLAVLSMLAGEDTKKKELIIYPIALAIFTTLVFVVGLKLPMPIWPTFL